jgi:hypothetical protein
VSKWGKTSQGKQRYHCNNAACAVITFLLEYTYAGCQPGMHEHIVDLTLNSSGIRDIARSERVSPTTVIAVLKAQQSQVEYVNRAVLDRRTAAKIIVRLHTVIALEAEGDEMWSYVGKKVSSVGCGTRLTI